MAGLADNGAVLFDGDSDIGRGEVLADCSSHGVHGEFSTIE
jgi:hypothetical protein